jgi:type IV pilus assembly protein PilP
MTVLLLGVGLAACSRVQNYSDLQQFVAEVKSRPGGAVDPVPEFVPYEGFIYSAASQRSPFDEPIVIDSESDSPLAQDVQPDFDRPPEELENQALSELKMVGMLVKQGVYQALIEDGFGEIHRVGIGNYLGRNYGRIENISRTQVNLREIVPSGNGGWVERPQTLTLQ